MKRKPKSTILNAFAYANQEARKEAYMVNLIPKDLEGAVVDRVETRTLPLSSPKDYNIYFMDQKGSPHMILKSKLYELIRGHEGDFSELIETIERKA